MTYNIFLKSLRSLDEFRKNLYIKIPPKSPCINFQTLIYSKSNFYSETIFPSTFSPNSHSAFWPSADQQAKPYHQDMPPFPSSLPHPSRWLHGLLLSCHRVALLLHHGATPTDAPLLNSITCLYSDVNPPLFTACNRCLHGRPLKQP
jgi:hypothetical protein